MQNQVAEELEKKSEQKEREMMVSDEEMARRWVLQSMNTQTDNLLPEGKSLYFYLHLTGWNVCWSTLCLIWYVTDTARWSIQSGISSPLSGNGHKPLEVNKQKKSRGSSRSHRMNEALGSIAEYSERYGCQTKGIECHGNMYCTLKPTKNEAMGTDVDTFWHLWLFPLS